MPWLHGHGVVTHNTTIGACTPPLPPGPLSPVLWPPVSGVVDPGYLVTGMVDTSRTARGVLVGAVGDGVGRLVGVIGNVCGESILSPSA